MGEGDGTDEKNVATITDVEFITESTGTSFIGARKGSKVTVMDNSSDDDVKINLDVNTNNANSNIKVYNGKYNELIVENKTSSAEIYGGSFETVSIDEKSDGATFYGGKYKNVNTETTIDDGKINCKDPVMAEGYMTKKFRTNGYNHVLPIIAKISGTNYAFLKDAVDDAEDKDVIVLQRDTYKEFIVVNRTVKFDIDNNGNKNNSTIVAGDDVVKFEKDHDKHDNKFYSFVSSFDLEIKEGDSDVTYTVYDKTARRFLKAEKDSHGKLVYKVIVGHMVVVNYEADEGYKIVDTRKDTAVIREMKHDVKLYAPETKKISKSVIEIGVKTTTTDVEENPNTGAVEMISADASAVIALSLISLAAVSFKKRK